MQVRNNLRDFSFTESDVERDAGGVGAVGEGDGPIFTLNTS
jgi:hypothetical protein